jgi:FlaA1/EpsC-like NDP-sugar epimerase
VLEEKNISRAGWARKQTQFALDLVVLIFAFVLAYLLRFDFAVPRSDWHRLSIQLPYVVLIQLVVISLAGVYTFVWRYIGLSEVRVFIGACLWSILPLVGLRVGLPERLFSWRVPFSVIVIDAILAFGGILFMRVLRRAVYERPLEAVGITHRRRSCRRPGG